MLRPEIENLAEQATLGALLRDSAPLEQIRGWLRAGDFVHPWHREVFTTILERHLAGEPVDEIAVAEALKERIGPLRARMVDLVVLPSAAPPRPASAEYARMVLDAGLRREVDGLGVMLCAGALQASVDGTAAPLTQTCNLVDAGLESAASRWATAHGAPRDEVVVPLALRAAGRGGEAREGAARYLAAHPARDLDAERQHVVDVVGALIAHPEAIPEVSSWLPVSRIPDPGWRLIYGTAIELAELGRPVDLVTVAWATRQHAQHGPALPGLDELRGAVEAGWFTTPTIAARAVAIDQARLLADTGARQLHQAAINPGVLIEDLVDTGHLVTTALRRTAAALPGHASGNGKVVALDPVAHSQAVSR
ncbi:MAG TPA: DnaB-like helicase N-terminal domain-containing protein [Propionicimonas sp.]|jgi:hypothetical protein